MGAPSAAEGADCVTEIWGRPRLMLAMWHTVCNAGTCLYLVPALCTSAAGRLHPAWCLGVRAGCKGGTWL